MGPENQSEIPKIRLDITIIFAKQATFWLIQKAKRTYKKRLILCKHSKQL